MDFNSNLTSLSFADGSGVQMGAGIGGVVLDGGGVMGKSREDSDLMSYRRLF